MSAGRVVLTEYHLQNTEAIECYANIQDINFDTNNLDFKIIVFRKDTIYANYYG